MLPVPPKAGSILTVLLLSSVLLLSCLVIFAELSVQNITVAVLPSHHQGAASLVSGIADLAQAVE